MSWSLTKGNKKRENSLYSCSRPKLWVLIIKDEQLLGLEIKTLIFISGCHLGYQNIEYHHFYACRNEIDEIHLVIGLEYLLDQDLNIYQDLLGDEQERC